MTIFNFLNLTDHTDNTDLTAHKQAKFLSSTHTWRGRFYPLIKADPTRLKATGIWCVTVQEFNNLERSDKYYIPRGMMAKSINIIYARDTYVRDTYARDTYVRDTYVRDTYARDTYDLL